MYLLDDGRDVEKKKFMHSLGVGNVVYVRCAGHSPCRLGLVRGWRMRILSRYPPPFPPSLPCRHPRCTIAVPSAPAAGASAPRER